ncbi:hypothetical protein HMPREF1545_03054 [Oscillibacter sp. KLE 1728]|nr:hypothetical protein HMPREF1545_03054 [Oscillibacter sp. KLE 1728]ERK58587.1 hypothetical protein HMPREF1546_03652 [Oscillibacter sp. KLE 1745]
MQKRWVSHHDWPIGFCNSSCGSAVTKRKSIQKKRSQGTWPLKRKAVKLLQQSGGRCVSENTA